MQNQEQAAIGRAFPLEGTLQRLAGGEGRAYRAGAVVYRREVRVDEATFVADLYASLRPQGFRLPQPIRSFQGTWVSTDGWSAWSFVDGRPATTDDIPAVIAASDAFHHALQAHPYPPFLAVKDTLYTRANAAAWAEPPTALHPSLFPLVSRLLALRQNLARYPAQLVHGDLNSDNILIAEGAAPALIDFTPCWYPVGFALAVFAYWLGPYRGDTSVLNCFTHIPAFDQLLLRVVLSKLYVAHECIQLGHRPADEIVSLQAPVSCIVDWMQRNTHALPD